jgi:ferrous iron transport protein B
MREASIPNGTIQSAAAPSTQQAPIAAVRRIALLGNPNCGKTALFNLLTGSRQKVANYPGVTVERKSGIIVTPTGRRIDVLDLPGTYSLNTSTSASDQALTRDIITGNSSEPSPELLVCVADATKLALNLQLVLQAQRLDIPMVLVLNMSDMARAQGIIIDTQALSASLGMPVVSTVGIKKGGAQALLELLDQTPPPAGAPNSHPWQQPTMEDILAHQQTIRQILDLSVQDPQRQWLQSDRFDQLALHPVFGLVMLALTMLLMFQAVFIWAEWPMGLIESATEWIGEQVATWVTEGPLQSLLVDGIVAGVGGVLVFLPQILILYFFILLLEDSGYLTRAAFLLDRLMGFAGLSGRSFIPLLSSFACNIPGILATRSIGNWRDRLLTILIVPLMACSARLPVYTLLIAAFIPQRQIWGLFNLKGLVLFGLYVFPIIVAMLIAWSLQAWQRFTGKGNFQRPPLLMELPAYRWPSLRSVVLGLVDRAVLFLRKAGSLILALSILLWFLSSYPSPPENASGPAIEYSLAGRIGHGLEYLLAPLGFNWQIAVALIPGLAAREVMVSALGTVYALSGDAGDVAIKLEGALTNEWSLPTGLSLLVWFIFAPQCLPTLAVIKRETNSWRTAALVALYLFTLAYVASFITYRLALAWS